MSSDKLAQLENQMHINLETYKKSNQAIKTPVWFVVNNGQIYVTTLPHTGKVKRIKNNQNVRIMVCGMRGEPRGEWISGMARFADEAESEMAVKLRNKKYGIKAKLIGTFVYRGKKPTVIAIQI
jgi:hypothetical protein